MEVYLENMKSLRSYMNDLEEVAAKRSAEEQQQRTAIEAHDADIALVRAQAKQASEEAEQLATTRAQVGIGMAKKKVRKAVLEVECATLKQALVLLHQEIASISAQLDEKRLFYTKITGTLTVKLQKHQVATSLIKQNFIEGEKHGIFDSEGRLDKFESDVANKHEELNKLESAQPKLQDIKSKRSVLLLETSKVKQILEQEKSILACFPVALQQMDIKTLGEEYKVLQGDNVGEIEYFHSLEEMINGMKGVSVPVKCRCGL
ncbi:hypothetical protein BS78_07G127200 [Paspalum vaginatum]|nr:hypothetical protein BS78_07G127200 [Paspalum vaginatum]